MLVEDDKTIASGLEYSLEKEGFSTVLCHNVASGKKAFLENKFDLCLLDLSLPDGSGYDLCKFIREESEVPIIFLTACDDEVNVVMGLDMGADDYITKPFRLRELISRIKSVLRRYNKEDDSNKIIKLNNLIINTLEAKVYKNGQEVNLTALEYRLLLIFANNKGQDL